MSDRLRDVPTWVLVACFAILAVVFALADTLDDWVRVVLAVTFAVIALALVARWRTEHVPVASKPAPASPAPVSDAG